jgi:hypothetical protein
MLLYAPQRSMFLDTGIRHKVKRQTNLKTASDSGFSLVG